MRVEAEKAEPVDWAVEPRELTPGVAAARTLLSNSTCVLARVLNYSDMQVVLEPDSYFSCAEPAVAVSETRPGVLTDPGDSRPRVATEWNRPCGSASESKTC